MQQTCEPLSNRKKASRVNFKSFPNSEKKQITKTHEDKQKQHNMTRCSDDDVESSDVESFICSLFPSSYDS